MEHAAGSPQDAQSPPRCYRHPDRETRIRYDDTPMHVYVEQIGERVRTEGRTAFTSLFERETIRSRIVSMFLAVLELLRHHGFRAEQPVDYGEIWILPPAASLSIASVDETAPEAGDAPPGDAFSG